MQFTDDYRSLVNATPSLNHSTFSVSVGEKPAGLQLEFGV